MKQPVRPLSLTDWLRAAPWLIAAEAIYLLPYLARAGGVAAKYIWDEHCVSHTYPVAWLAREEFRQGFFPLWDPFSGCGLPLLGNTLDESILPYSIVKYLLPFPLGLNVFIAVKLFIALTGAFALGRSLGSTRPGAILAAMIYGFTGFITLNVNSVIGSTFLLPWCVFAMHRLALRPNLGAALLTAAAFGLSLMGGNPQTPFQALIIGCGLYLLLMLTWRPPFSVGKYFLLPAAAVSAGALLALPQLLPFLEYLTRAFSHHLPGYGRVHLDPRGFIGVMSPLWDAAILLMNGKFFSTPLNTIIAMQFPPASYAAASIPIPFEHLGIVAVFFIILTIANLRRLPVEAAYFAGVAITCLGLAYGIFPFSLIARVPPFDQVSNWRFTTFPAGLACAALAALILPRLGRPAFRKTIWPALAVLIFLAGLGMALVESRAGLPVTSFLIVGPVLGVVAGISLLGVAVRLRRPEPLIVLAFLELFLYDRVTDRSLLPHPHQVLRKPEAVTACARPDPAYRFLAYGEVIHPSLGILLDRSDFRSYEMIFPQDLVQWIEAVNGWSHLNAVQFYLTHYYFAPTPDRLLSPELAKASVRDLLADNFLPAPEFVGDLLSQSEILTPAPSYLHAARAEIDRVTRSGWFQHSPSLLVTRETFGLPTKIAAFVGMDPSAWSAGRGDGVEMMLLGGGGVVTDGKPVSGKTSLLYARYLDPKLHQDERRWIPFTFAAGDLLSLRSAVLPGPRNDAKSDYGLWMDFHDPKARAEFEKSWQLRDAGAVKCYELRDPRPRLRVAKAVEVSPSFADCLAGVRGGKWFAAEVVVDHTEGEWPSALIIGDTVWKVMVGHDYNAWPAGAGEVGKVDWGSNRVAAEVKMEAAGTLVLADTFYPGWRAVVDDTPVAIHRANCAFRAIQVPAGTHRVEFTFIPFSFRIGLWTGIVTWITLLGMVLPRRLRPNRPR